MNQSLARERSYGVSAMNGLDPEKYVRRDGDGYLYVVDHHVYLDEDVYKAELDHVFKQQWVYLGMEQEVARPGTFKTTYLADVGVVLVRDEDGKLHVYENVCLHRGAKLVRKRCGAATSFNCIYHSWSYDLKGALLAVPMPAGFRDTFRKEDYRLSELPRVETYAGMVFASYRADIEPLVEYLGEFTKYLDEILEGGNVEFIGYQRYHVSANWKLFVENTVDGYHPGLLHTPIMRDRGGYLYKPGQGHNYKFRNGHGLLQWPVTAVPKEDWDPEFDLPITYCVSRKDGWDYVSNIFPNVMVLYIEDIITIRQLIPRGVNEVDVITYNFGRPGESEEVRRHRAWAVSSQFGVAGVASLDDKLAMEAVQAGATARYSDTVLMRGKLSDSVGDVTSEISLRGFYEKWVDCFAGPEAQTRGKA